MSAPFRLTLAAALLVAGTAHADYRAGVAAWSRGDYPAAAREFEPAARAGDPESQFMMGRLYALGLGVPQNFVTAWTWQYRAAAQGHRLAAQAVRSLDGVLTPEQHAQAEAESGLPLLAEQRANPAAPPSTPPVVDSAGRAVELTPREGEVAELPR